jgi:hypothetical protein
MSADKPSSSQVLGALLRGDTDGLSRLVEQANLLQHPRGTGRDGSAADAASRVALEIPDSATEALREGRLIEAIRDVRLANPGLDLKAAKDAVEQLARDLPARTGKARSQAAIVLARARRPPTVASGDRGGLRAVVYALALAGGALAWWMLSGG